jgi:hypothetical protein
VTLLRFQCFLHLCRIDGRSHWQRDLIPKLYIPSAIKRMLKYALAHFCLIWPKKVHFEAKIYNFLLFMSINFLVADATIFYVGICFAQHCQKTKSKKSRFIWVFTVLGVYNFACFSVNNIGLIHRENVPNAQAFTIFIPAAFNLSSNCQVLKRKLSCE